MTIMNKRATSWTDQRVEIIVGNLLRVGVFLAAGVVLVGGLIFLVRHGREIPHYALFAGEPSELRTISGILAGVRTFHGRNIIQLGLLVLIATPVARVAFSVLAFVLERDRLYVGITLVVLGTLLFSLAGGHL
jgi:uncharacterized membrane protein